MPTWFAITLAAAFIVAVVVLGYRRQWQWTGLPAAHDVERPAKTLWDWLQLLGIPAALAALAFLLNDAQSGRDQRREDRRAADQRKIAADTEREDTLRSYLAQMSELILDRRLRHSDSTIDAREVARTATLTTVRRLDGRRRGLVVRFLAEAGLMNVSKPQPRVPVDSADLKHADLGGALLGETDLGGADLAGANLRGAELDGAVLAWADLRGAELSGASLADAFLVGADLRGAKLAGSYLAGADLRRARGVDMTGSRGRPAHPP